MRTFVTMLGFLMTISALASQSSAEENFVGRADLAVCFIKVPGGYIRGTGARPDIAVDDAIDSCSKRFGRSWADYRCDGWARGENNQTRCESYQ